MLDQLRPKGLHGGILFSAVAMRYDDDRSHTGASGREGHGLAVIAAGCCNNAGCIRGAALQGIHINQSAPDFERAGWGMVLMLYPHFGAAARR